MSLSYKIKSMPTEEQTTFSSMLNKCLKIRSMWCKALLDKTKTNDQCDFACKKFKEAEKALKEHFNYLHLNNFDLDTIKYCSI